MGQIETSREKLHKIFEDIMEECGFSKNVYFQPPENLKINYPCIIYHRQYLDGVKADNITYLVNRQYRLTYIDRSPINDGVIERLLNLPNCRYISHSVVDNLNQDTFEIYY